MKKIHALWKIISRCGNLCIFNCIIYSHRIANILLSNIFEMIIFQGLFSIEYTMVRKKGEKSLYVIEIHEIIYPHNTSYSSLKTVFLFYHSIIHKHCKNEFQS